jgi:hypothetical protein
MGYDDFNTIDRRLERELQRALRFKSASDSLVKNNQAKDQLFNRKKLETIIQNGINDSSMMPQAKNSLMEYSKSNPNDARYAKQLGFELQSAENLDKEKTQTRINLENALHKISNLDPLVQTNQDSLKAMTDNVNLWQDRAGELGMNQLLTTSNTRENKILGNLKKTDAINKSLNSFLKFNGDLDQYQLAYGDLKKTQLFLQTGELGKASTSLGDAYETKSTGRKRLTIGKNTNGSPLMGTLVGANEAFKKKFDEETQKWGWDLDDNGQRIFQDNIRTDISGFEGKPIIEDTKKVVPVGTKKPWDPGGASSEFLVANGYYKESAKDENGKVTDKWFAPDGEPADDEEMAQASLGFKTRRQVQQDNKVRIADRDTAAGTTIGQMIDLQRATFTVSPLNEKNTTGKSRNAGRFKKAHKVGFLFEKDWFDPKSMKSVESIELMQKDILSYMADNMDKFKPSTNLKGTYDSEDDRIKGARAVFESQEWKGLMSDNSDDKHLINENFDFIGVEPTGGWDDDSVSQADLLQRFYHIWYAMERQRMQLKGDALGGGGYAPGMPQ